MGPDKKILNTIDGDWNGTMFLKSGKKLEILINTQSMPLVRKRVRKLGEQLDVESRKLWQNVTHNLRKKNIASATIAKQSIEQKQRDGVKKRKEENEKWKPKYFYEDNESWIYVNPLKKRLVK